MKHYATWTGFWNYEKFTGGSLPTKIFLTDETILYCSNTPTNFLDEILKVYGDPKDWYVYGDRLYVSLNDYIVGTVDRLDSAKKEAFERWEEK